MNLEQQQDSFEKVEPIDFSSISKSRSENSRKSRNKTGIVRRPKIEISLVFTSGEPDRRFFASQLNNLIVSVLESHK